MVLGAAARRLDDSPPRAPRVTISGLSSWSNVYFDVPNERSLAGGAVLRGLELKTRLEVR